ncbi:MAG: hypothetical protein KBS35_02305 [Mycoplasma sp.]|nr:hypothetical protein [Candidatus Hennigella equi]
MKLSKILPILTIASLPAVSLPLISCANDQTIDDSTPLCFMDVKGDHKKSQITYTIDGRPLDIDIEYKLGNGHWRKWQKGKKITLNDGNKVYVRNTKNTLSRLDSCFKFVTTGGDVIGCGNVDSMINYAPLTTGCFIYLFADCKTLKRAPALPAITLAESCYQNMFWNCTGLTQAPELPASKMVDYCYTAMFSGCTSLKVAPELKSTQLAPHCYDQMFDVCGITKAPQLPAEQLAEGCYACMFCHCPIIDTPALPSTHLADKCYYYMFANCRQLQRTTDVLPATELKQSCYNHMFAYCHELTAAPEIKGHITPIESEQQCFEKMFKDCPKLNVQQDAPSGRLINSFGDILPTFMPLFAKEMFGIDGSTRPWDEGGNPIGKHAYYWIEQEK